MFFFKLSLAVTKKLLLIFRRMFLGKIIIFQIINKKNKKLHAHIDITCEKTKSPFSKGLIVKLVNDLFLFRIEDGFIFDFVINEFQEFID